jgi:VWFA-related protein
MKSILKLLFLIVPVLFVVGTTAAQSCVTPEQVKSLAARVKNPKADVTLNKKLRDELLKLWDKDEELLSKMLAKKGGDDNKAREDLEKHRQKSQERLCKILKSDGWPTSSFVGQDGATAAFTIFQNAPSSRLQRDMVPVIVAAVEKNEIDKPHFAALFDRMRIRAGMNQLFGTQATVRNGVLVLAPIEAEAQVDVRRKEFGLSPLQPYLRLLERTYRLPLVRSPNSPADKHRARPAELDKSALGELVDSAADDIEVLRIETNLVSLNVSVYNTKLKSIVNNLEQKDFSVLEDGQEETLSFFAATTVPFDLVLLIDLSGSTADKRDLIRTSTKRFIEAARPIDRLSIVIFSTTPEVIAPLTSDRTQLLASIQRIDATEGDSNVWDALDYTLKEVIGSRSTERRKAIVLMSDGVDNALGFKPEYGSLISFAELVEKVRHSDAMIIPIYLNTESGRRASGFMKTMYENARRTLPLLAEESGGLYYKASKIGDLEGVYEQVINDLGKVYSLGYKPSRENHDGSWRTVKIRLAKHPDLIPRTRPGYYAN